MSDSVSNSHEEEAVGVDNGGVAWLDVESDPAEFQKILRNLGADGVSVQELYGLEDDAIYMLTGQVLGMIFLFNYRQVDGEEEEDVQDCPAGVWFANQTTNNSCATVAMLNILLNIPGIKFDSGGNNILADLKTSTTNLHPTERGQRLSENGNIRRIHNASAREMDAINASLLVQRDYEEWMKSTRYRRKSGSAKRKRTSTGKSKKSKQDTEDAYHYIAYVPIGQDVWRLDGLLKQPRNLGRFHGDWTSIARQNILQRIEEEEALEYNLMALCAGEKQTIFLQSLKNAVAIDMVKQNIPGTSEDIAQWLKENDAKPMDEAELLCNFGITMGQIRENGELADDILERMQTQDHLTLLRRLLVEQDNLKTLYHRHRKLDVQDDAGKDMNNEVDLTGATFDILKALVEASMIPATAKR